MKNLCITLSVLLSIITVAGVTFADNLQREERPPIHLRPELYLGWQQKPERPEIKKLPWLLEITIRAVTPSPYNLVVAGPLKIHTREEFFGISYGQGELLPSMQDASTNNALTAGPRVELQSLELAGQVGTEGANVINLRCHVALRTIREARVKTHSTTATLECQPGKETILAEFPDLILYLTAIWKGPVSTR